MLLGTRLLDVIYVGRRTFLCYHTDADGGIAAGTFAALATILDLATALGGIP